EETGVCVNTRGSSVFSDGVAGDFKRRTSSQEIRRGRWVAGKRAKNPGRRVPSLRTLHSQESLHISRSRQERDQGQVVSDSSGSAGAEESCCVRDKERE